MNSVNQSAPPGKPFECTDAGNAERFVMRYGTEFRYCTEEKRWYTWREKRWEPIATEALYQAATDTVRTITGEINANSVNAGELSDWRHRSQSRERITAMIDLARGYLSISKGVFDRDPYLLNCNNGTLDLKRWQFKQQHDRNDYITKLIPIDYDPNAQCPRWLRFLHEVFAVKPETVSFVQTAIGYSLTGDVKEEVFFLLYGAHRNGKGTLTGTLLRLLGEYGCTIDFDALVAKRNAGGPKDDIARMNGKRFVVAHENREGVRLAAEEVKLLTGGDKVSARLLYQNSTEFDPTWKLWLSVNHKPIISSTDPAMWDRLVVVPFEVSFAGREERGLKQELLAELPGILRWAVEGYRGYRDMGLKPPECVLECSADYRRSMNPLGDFVEDECTVGNGLSVVGGGVISKVPGVFGGEW